MLRRGAPSLHHLRRCDMRRRRVIPAVVCTSCVFLCGHPFVLLWMRCSMTCSRVSEWHLGCCGGSTAFSRSEAIVEEEEWYQGLVVIRLL